MSCLLRRDDDVTQVSGSVARAASILLILACLAPVAGRSAFAQGGRFAVVVQGASGEPQYAKLHRSWVDGLTTALREAFGYDPAQITVLAETPGEGETRATAENVRATMTRLSGRLTPADQLLVVFIGHGTGQGTEAKFNLIGPDLSVADWSALLKPVQAKLAVVDTTSASYPYLQGLAAPGRVIVSATNSVAQRFHTVFPDAFVRALTASESDQDKNGRISILEAFQHASRLVKEHYEQKPAMATETPVLDDTGEGKGRLATVESPSTSIAALLYLDAPKVATSADPETQKLLTRQQALTDQIDELRRQRGSMPAADFDRQLEALLLELAEVSGEVRRRSGG
jgi:hypothetical protein